jgi:hypothetical protein
MQLTDLLVAGAMAAPVAVFQWWAMNRFHRRARVAAERRHVKAQQSTARMLQQAKEQVAQLQKALAAEQLKAARVPRAQPRTSTGSSAARKTLTETLDETSASRKEPPANGFADTLPAPQFPHESRL